LEPPDVADLGHEHRGQDPADAVEGLNRLVTVVALQPGVDGDVEHGDLAVEGGDQVAQRLEARLVGRRQVQLVERPRASGTPELLDGREHALFGQHGVDLSLEPGLDGSALRPVADELAN
jgi:hypothetical protein